MNLQELINYHQAKRDQSVTPESTTLHCNAVGLLSTLLKSADIEVIPSIGWNAQAAIHDALNQIKVDSICMVLWLDKDDQVQATCNATYQQMVWMMNVQLNLILSARVES